MVLFNTTYTDPLRTMTLSRLLQALRKPLLVPMMYLQIWLWPLVWLMQWQSYLSGSQHIAVRSGFGRDVTRSQLDHTALLMTRNSPAVVARGDLAMMRWDGAEGVAKLAAPTLVLGGTRDIVTRFEASEAIVSLAPDARLQAASGANHMDRSSNRPLTIKPLPTSLRIEQRETEFDVSSLYTAAGLRGLTHRLSRRYPPAAASVRLALILRRKER